MIPTDRLDVFEVGCSILEDFGTRTNVRGRFATLYLPEFRSWLRPVGMNVGVEQGKRA